MEVDDTKKRADDLIQERSEGQKRLVSRVLERSKVSQVTPDDDDPTQVLDLQDEGDDDGTEVQQVAGGEEESQDSGEQEKEASSDDVPEESTDTEDEDLVTALRQRIADLTLQNAQLATRTSQTKEAGEPKEPDVKDFLTPEELEKMKDDPSVVNEGFKRMYAKLREDALQNMPKVITSTAKREDELNKAVTAFWSDNEDLKPFKNHVVAVATMIEDKYPGLSPEQIFSLTANQVRKDFHMQKVAKTTQAAATTKTQESSARKKKPAFAGGTGGGATSQSKKPTREQKLISRALSKGPIR